MRTGNTSVGIIALVVGIAGICLGCWFLSDDVKPELPITVRLRDSAIGKGYVAQFYNNSDKYLTIKALFGNSTLDQNAQSVIELGRGETKEFGWLQGWTFTSGETITLVHRDYKPMRIKIR